MKHLMTFESFHPVNEEFSLSGFFSKIASKLNNPEIDKIKDQFNKDLPNLINNLIEKENLANVDTEELADIVKKTNQKLPEVVSTKLNESYRPSGVNTSGGEEKESKVHDFIFMILNMATGSSLFYLIWKVVLDWWLMHRGLIDLELGFWGKVAIFMTLIGVICNGLYENRHKWKSLKNQK